MRALCYNTPVMPRWLFPCLVTLCIWRAPAAGAQASQSGSPSRLSAAESRAQTILVFPFENKGRAPHLEWLGEGLSELTTERLQDRGAIVLSRQDRLAALEKMGLPDSARFSHASLVKIATDADADVVIFGEYSSDGTTITLEAHVLRVSPPSLSQPLTESAALQDLPRAHARLAWQLLCAIDKTICPAAGASRDETTFSDPPPSLRLDALENLVRGITSSGDEERLRLLREAARLEPAWDRPPFEVGTIYFDRRDCELALPWLSRVPPNRPDGAEAAFDAGVCHLARNDLARAAATFSGLIERSRSADLRERLPELPEAHNNLGVAQLRLGKWSEAGNEFERATEVDPAEPSYWVNLAIAKLAAKQMPAAVAPLETARKLSPDDADARAMLIGVLQSLGRNADAEEVRGESPNVAAPPNLQDAAQLAHLARVSKKFDRTFLRPPTDPAPAAPAGREAIPRETRGGL